MSGPRRKFGRFLTEEVRDVAWYTEISSAGKSNVKASWCIERVQWKSGSGCDRYVGFHCLWRAFAQKHRPELCDGLLRPARGDVGGRSFLFPSQAFSRSYGAQVMLSGGRGADRQIDADLMRRSGKVAMRCARSRGRV